MTYGSETWTLSVEHEWNLGRHEDDQMDVQCDTEYERAVQSRAKIEDQRPYGCGVTWRHQSFHRGGKPGTCLPRALSSGIEPTSVVLKLFHVEDPQIDTYQLADPQSIIQDDHIRRS